MKLFLWTFGPKTWVCVIQGSTLYPAKYSTSRVSWTHLQNSVIQNSQEPGDVTCQQPCAPLPLHYHPHYPTRAQEHRNPHTHTVFGRSISNGASNAHYVPDSHLRRTGEACIHKNIISNMRHYNGEWVAKTGKDPRQKPLEKNNIVSYWEDNGKVYGKMSSGTRAEWIRGFGATDSQRRWRGIHAAGSCASRKNDARAAWPFSVSWNPWSTIRNEAPEVQAAARDTEYLTKRESWAVLTNYVIRWLPDSMRGDMLLAPRLYMVLLHGKVCSLTPECEF